MRNIQCHTIRVDMIVRDVADKGTCTQRTYRGAA